MLVYGTKSNDDLMKPNFVGAPSVVLFEKYLLAASFLVLIFSKKIGFSLGKIKKVADSVAPSVVLFEKYLLAASSLVLIFFKKVGFSFAKFGKVVTPFC